MYTNLNHYKEAYFGLAAIYYKTNQNKEEALKLSIILIMKI